MSFKLLHKMREYVTWGRKKERVLVCFYHRDLNDVRLENLNNFILKVAQYLGELAIDIRMS